MQWLMLMNEMLMNTFSSITLPILSDFVTCRGPSAAAAIPPPTNYMTGSKPHICAVNFNGHLAWDMQKCSIVISGP